MCGVVVLLSKPLFIVIVAVVCVVIAVAKLSDSILNLGRISFQFGRFANFKALFPAVPTNFAKEKFAAAFGIYRCHNHIKV